jgi:hypothetical protein
MLLVSVPLGAISTSRPALVRGPYLRNVRLTFATVMRRTDVPAVCGLEVRLAGSATSSVVAGTTDTACTLIASGLRPGAAYAYVALADDVPLTAASVFRTDDRELPFGFAVLGDSGSGDPPQFAVAQRMAARAPDFVVHTGEMIYPDAAPEE